MIKLLSNLQDALTGKFGMIAGNIIFILGLELWIPGSLGWLFGAWVFKLIWENTDDDE
jgi:hypothetical protein